MFENKLFYKSCTTDCIIMKMTADKHDDDISSHDASNLWFETRMWHESQVCASYVQCTFNLPLPNMH